MNHLRSILALLATTGLASAADVDLRPAFAWRQSVEGHFESGRVYRILVDPGVFDGCRAFPADVRIIADDGASWPFFILAPEEKGAAENVSLRPLGDAAADETGVAEQSFSVARDPATGAIRPHNQLIVRTSGDHFVRRLEVLGSEDSSDWKRLGEGTLVNSSGGGHTMENRVEYSQSVLPLLRVRVFPDAREAGDRPVIEGVFCARRAAVTNEMHGVRLKTLAVASEDRKENGQVLVFDARARNMPIERLIIASRDADYAVPVRVYGRNYETNAWRWVADGLIQRAGATARDAIPMSGFTFRYMKLELDYGARGPLSGLSVHAEAAPRYLVFEAGVGARPVLYFGASGMEEQTSNLRRRRGAEALTAKLVRLGQLESTRAAGSRWSRQSVAGTLIAAFVAAASVVMIARARRRTGRPGVL